jgi:hypothetical protein
MDDDRVFCEEQPPIQPWSLIHLQPLNVVQVSILSLKLDKIDDFVAFLFNSPP